ncbi:MAG: hypothetical protein JO042_14595 [Sinobacteraceae bacterium]|nr:hypothetical protein [Nevskiaceae bacterium]
MRARAYEIAPVPWAEYDAISPTELVIRYQVLLEYEYVRADVSESEREVAITVYERVPANSKLVPVQREVHVRLGSPINDRRVLDGAVSKAGSQRAALDGAS